MMYYRNPDLRKLNGRIRSSIKTITESTVYNIPYYYSNEGLQDLLKYKHSLDHYWEYLDNTINISDDAPNSLNRKNFEQDFKDCTEIKIKVNNFLLSYLNLI